MLCRPGMKPESCVGCVMFCVLDPHTVPDGPACSGGRRAVDTAHGAGGSAQISTQGTHAHTHSLTYPRTHSHAVESPSS